MTVEKVSIGASHGIHMRVAGAIVQEASKYQSNITIRKSGVGTANAKSILSVISLAIKQGEEVQLEATGEDENEAVSALIPLFG